MNLKYFWALKLSVSLHLKRENYPPTAVITILNYHGRIYNTSLRIFGAKVRQMFALQSKVLENYEGCSSKTRNEVVYPWIQNITHFFIKNFFYIISPKTNAHVLLGLPPLHHAQSPTSKHAIKYTSDSPLNLFQIVMFFTSKLRFKPSKQPEVSGGQVWGMGCVLKHFDPFGGNKGQN